MKPFAYYSSGVVKEFITDSLNRSMDDLAIQLEAYVMSGLKGARQQTTAVCFMILTPFFSGVVVNSKTKALELKSKTTALIIEKLRTYISCRALKPYASAERATVGALTEVNIPRMAYDRFDELITRKYHVVVRNWPLKKFCNPSAIASRIELQLLYNSWHSGTTYFEKLTEKEMELWENEQFSSRMDLTPPTEPIPATEFSPQVHLDLAPAVAPDPPRGVPMASITNITSGPTSMTALDPPAPDPNVIAMMIQADPTLQNVDPTLIAMGITASTQHQMTATPSVTPPTEQPPNQALRTGGSKRRWQEVITPLSYDGRTVKRPKRRQKDKHPRDRTQGTR